MLSLLPATTPSDNPYLGEIWYDTDENKVYVWLGRWVEYDGSGPMDAEDIFDPVKAYDRAKGIL